MKLVYTETTPFDRERVYGRVQSTRESGAVTAERYGTIATEVLDLEPVQDTIQTEGVVPLETLDGYYTDQIEEDFEERSLESFVEEFVERTPFTRMEAGVIVTHGWFDMSIENAVRAINQHITDADHDEITAEDFERIRRSATETRAQIYQALEYPFLI